MLGKPKLNYFTKRTWIDSRKFIGLIGQNKNSGWALAILNEKNGFEVLVVGRTAELWKE